jgi:hypothetical protein
MLQQHNPTLNDNFVYAVQYELAKNAMQRSAVPATSPAATPAIL